MQQQADKISIIIPVLNESRYIGQLLDHLMANASAENIEEVIVVDGGSGDGSQEIIANFKEVLLLNTEKGRARQLNAGAKVAKGSILYFLHADTFPPKDFDKKILEQSARKKAGCFRLKFENPDHFLLKIAPWFTRINISLFRGGDQSLFIRKTDFEYLKGYNERYPIYEDVELINRIYKNYTFKIIPDYVVTSERRFREHGVWNLYFAFLMVHVRSWLGVAPEGLGRDFE